MSRERFEGHWNPAKVHVKEQWRKLAVESQAGKVHDKYTAAQREAEREVKDWEMRKLRLFE